MAEIPTLARGRLHQRFRDIYGDQIQLYGTHPTSEDTLSYVRELIERAAEKSPLPLRPDAHLFLLINIHQMLVLPLSHSDSPTPFSDVVSELEGDLDRVISAANDRAPGRVELAASHILWGTSDILDDLHIKSWRIWERDE